MLDIEAKYEQDFRRTVLIVDDEPVNLRLMGNILGDEYDLFYAESGEEALDIIHKEKDFLSLVLLDLHLKGMDGYEVLKSLQSDDSLRAIPVIVLTSDKEAEVKSLELGAVDFLSKPFDKTQVIKARIRRSIELAIDRNIISLTGTDSLTGLLTKQFLFQYAGEYDKFHPDNGVDAIVVNFSKFHLLNELYGRSYGDKVLCAIAEGVRAVARKHGGVASRVDADIFYMYIEHQEDYETLVKEIKIPLESVMKPGDIRLKVGIYQDIFHTASLYQRFDRALEACNLHSKSLQSESYIVYDNAMHEQEIYVARLLEDIDSAIKQGQFSLVFQPKYDITGKGAKLCSAEVLVRWRHPKYGNVRPDFFIPLFEENGLIKELDRFVWTEAAKAIRRWKDMYGMTIPVSVNVSRVDIFDPDLTCFLKKILSDNGLTAENMHLEITETAYTDNTSQFFNIARELRNEGFKLEMDDFGKGYSSLNMLTSLPIDALKLDMAFIKDIAEDNKEMKMVEFIISIGQFLNVPVIAEGVETKEQYLLLKKAGCNLIQGYYFSKPLTESEFGALIEKEEAEK
ncbi:MAG: EAL domain-containing protein [Butyrivibrio sp.]|nr:EAL domain-containing protein [Butyrivibrio sp.]